MTMPVFASGDLDALRRDLLGSDATLTFYEITPTAGETEIAVIETGWHLWRLPRTTGEASPGAVKVMLAHNVAVDVEDLRVGTVLSVYVNERARKYRIIELMETQQLGGGWVIVADPMTDTV